MESFLAWLQQSQVAPTIVSALKSTWVSQQMTGSPWLWPICESLHFVGLALVIGIAGLFDLRMMGLMLRRVPVAVVMQLRPWAAAGVLINLVTGVLFFVGAPDQYIGNRAWWWKVVFLLIAFANIALFETGWGRRMLHAAGDRPLPLACRIAGATSLGSWLMVLYWGRMLPFIGNAF